MDKGNKPGGEIMRFLTVRREAPKFTIIIPIIIYVALYICTAYSAGSGLILTVGGSELPLSALTGVFTYLSCICLIVIVLYYKKFGFITALLLELIGMPSYLINFFAKHNVRTLPGFFSCVFTIIMLVIIHISRCRMEKNQKQLRNLFEQTAKALVNAIDTKDTYTHGHSSRVAEYSRRLAELNHKRKDECDMIYYAALLHDVGKIGVPIRIINKPGKLTSEEYDIIKQHPANGAKILEKISDFPFLSIGAHYHHERYDGKGYPEGLKGEDIPEIAKIIAVADAYDAMTSIRSYRDPIPQDKVREEIVKGIGTQFDPVYARLMLHLIDIDTEYEMKERKKAKQSEDGVFTVGEHRSAVHDGMLTAQNMRTISMSVRSADEATGVVPAPSMILFDSLDGKVHTEEAKVKELLYFEYGEIWFDGYTETGGARKMQTKIITGGSGDIKNKGDYRIEAVRIEDHALIRIIGKERTAEVIVALPDSTRFMYIALTGENCSISDITVVRAEEKSPDDYIPRIAEKISYINVPAGDVPNVQVDGFRTAASEGIEVKDGLKLTFHTMSLPTARLVWHCPYISLFCSDDGKVNGNNYRELAFARFDGEGWESDTDCSAELNVRKTDRFEGWDSWKKYNLDGYDAVVTFKVDDNRITVITENAGIDISNTFIMTGIDKPIYATITGDQIAVTNIRAKY
ncbi:MAG: HD-GYP domain-containing protein [Oscillospiraceae bacterium]|nr:HD-GYP domain-containing protein [Oscillospiraceae bacterium]